MHFFMVLQGHHSVPVRLECGMHAPENWIDVLILKVLTNFRVAGFNYILEVICDIQ